MRAQFVIPVLVSILVFSILVFNQPNYAYALDTDFLFKFGSFGSGDGQFNIPFGVAVDPISGNIIVGDSFNNRIQVFDSSGTFLTTFGSFGSGDGQFIFLVGVAVDPSSGNILVSDTFNGRIQVFDSNGNFLIKFGSFCRLSDGTGCIDPDGGGPLELGDGQFLGAHSVAVDPSSGNIIVTDSSDHSRIQVFDSNGNFLIKFGSSCRISDGLGCIDPDGDGPLDLGDGQFLILSGVAVDPSSGNILVSDRANNRIQVFDSNGNFLIKFGSFCRISDGTGCIDPDGGGPLDLGDGQFNNPAGIVVDPSSGNIVVSGIFNHRIQVFDSNRNFLIKFGSFCRISDGTGCIDPDGGGPLDLGDGQFNNPAGIVVDPSSGNIVVSDLNNHRIQVFGTLSIQDLINQINGLENVSENVKASLAAPLNQAITLLEDGIPQNDASVCRMITAFLSVVDAKERTMQLTSVQASELRATAQSIENSLGC